MRIRGSRLEGQSQRSWEDRNEAVEVLLDINSVLATWRPRLRRKAASTVITERFLRIAPASLPTRPCNLPPSSPETPITTVTWTVTCATGVTAPTCGTIDTNGLYTAPATIPTATSKGLRRSLLRPRLRQRRTRIRRRPQRPRSRSLPESAFRLLRRPPRSAPANISPSSRRSTIRDATQAQIPTA